MFKENTHLSGKLTILLTDSKGNVKECREETNTVVTTGLNFIASRIGGDSSSLMSHMAIGSGTTTAAASDTDLESILGSREALDSTTVTNNTIKYIASFESGEGSGAVTEAGIFNASSGGTMLCRTTFPVVNKIVDDVLTITWTITVNAA